MNFARKEKFILWESSCFELFGDGKYSLLLIQNVQKMMVNSGSDIERHKYKKM